MHSFNTTAKVWLNELKFPGQIVGLLFSWKNEILKKNVQISCDVSLDNMLWVKTKKGYVESDMLLYLLYLYVFEILGVTFF